MIEPNIPGDTNAHMIYIPVVVFVVVCPTLVGLRVWSRLRKGGGLSSDDWAILGSLLFTLASSAVMVTSCQYGFGQHIGNITPANKIETLRYFWLCQITYKVSINLTKASILLLYHRIFSPTVPHFRIACYILLAAVATYGIASVVATIFQCSPLPRAFDKTIPGTCINIAQFWYANASFSISSDILILLLPMYPAWKLQIPNVQKIALLFIFGLGGFVLLTSCLRMTTIDIAASSPDGTFDIASTMWTIVEMNVAVVCACLPMLRPFIVKVFPRMMPRSSGGRSRGGTKYGGGFGSQGYKISVHSRTAPSDEDEDGGDRHRSVGVILGGGEDGGIRMMDVKKKQDDEETGSEDYILDDHDGRMSSPVSRGIGIQKTFQVSVEYGKEKPTHGFV